MVNVRVPEDIRDKRYLNHGDVMGLNFIRSPAKYHYRRYYRAGLRSHIMEVLDPDDVHKETEGVTVDEIKRYPRAKPIKILRLFRIRFKNIEEAKYRMLEDREPEPWPQRKGEQP